MLNSKTINSSVNEHYSNLKNKMLAVKTHNLNVLNNIQGFTELENSIGKLKFELATAEYEKNTDLINKLKAEIEILNQKRAQIIKSANLVKYKYECPLCKDTGFLNGKKCKCYLSNVSNVILNELGIKNTNLYSFKNANAIPELKKHYAFSEKFASTFPKTSVYNLVFTGSVGTGKTHLSKCIFTELTSKGYNSLFLSATELNNLFLKMHIGELDRVLTLEMLAECDLLIIDDLGVEPMYNNVTVEYLLATLSLRIQNKKHFIITTNLTHNEILSRYGERLLSRFSNSNETMFIPFNNADLRRK